MAANSGSSLIGNVDLERRILFRLFLFCIQDEILVQLDTGCTWEMIMERPVARALGILRQKSVITTSGVIASGKSHEFEIYTTDVLWLDEVRRIGVRVPVLLPGESENRRARLPSDGMPYAMVGAALLEGLRLNIEFGNKRMFMAERM